MLFEGGAIGGGCCMSTDRRRDDEKRFNEGIEESPRLISSGKQQGHLAYPSVCCSMKLVVGRGLDDELCRHQ
jgi:hypothetical protein